MKITPIDPATLFVPAGSTDMMKNQTGEIVAPIPGGHTDMPGDSAAATTPATPVSTSTPGTTSATPASPAISPTTTLAPVLAPQAPSASTTPGTIDPALARKIGDGILHLLSFQLSIATKLVNLANLKREIALLAAAAPTEADTFYAIYLQRFGANPIKAIETELTELGSKRRNLRSAMTIDGNMRSFVTKLAAAVANGGNTDALLATL